MTFIDFFAGVGGFRKGLENAGHKCVGFCEWDKYAAASYTAMHLITEEQRAYLMTLDKKQRVKEILKEEYRNGEWYSTDIRLVNAANVPRCDCWCFGAPCQDFSICGTRAGLDGDRSSLVREVFRVLRELEEDDRPEWLIYENVKGMFSSNRGRDYLSILLEMDECGYDAEWFNFNSKYHGVPQNRERVYTVGHFRGRGRAEVFPLKGTNREDSLGGSQFYQQDRIYDGESVGTSLSHDLTGGANYYAIKQVGRLGGCKRDNPERFRVYDPQGIAATVHTMGGGGQEPHIIVAVEVPGPEEPNEIKPGIVIVFPNGVHAFAIWYHKRQCWVVIRKLTPRECFRLQGWEDEYFERAEMVNSDSQLYKQAGNGVTVNVVEVIGKRLKEIEDGKYLAEG